ncbi:hypothetical protein LLY42_05635 [Pseudomonas frederiksbergensis]|uniref:Uncharacterized protein n=1 Tax=Pseudomonas cucumis TaxID=2954082 RepID=A0ABY9EX93_9PSED|nr:hypothetical protein [Pseudomonas cucumis]URM29098.1 hypothetical protein LLY42_05635 [Pseudomonas frederiksbergensis]WLG84803.1 hypothetical protein PSH97_27650 [Pseudomonas cucumis]
MEGYLAVIADSNLFGALALLCLVLILTGLRRGFRESLLHRGLTLVVLMAVVVMELAGSYYANLSQA